MKTVLLRLPGVSIRAVIRNAVLVTAMLIGWLLLMIPTTILGIYYIIHNISWAVNTISS